MASEYLYRPAYGTVTRIADGVVVVPAHDDQAPDYLAWLAWCAAGNEPTIDDSMPPFVPQVVTRRQMFVALEEAGMLARIKAFVATQPPRVQIEWDESLEFHYDNAFIWRFASEVGLTAEGVAGLFIAAHAVPG